MDGDVFLTLILEARNEIRGHNGAHNINHETIWKILNEIDDLFHFNHIDRNYLEALTVFKRFLQNNQYNCADYILNYIVYLASNKSITFTEDKYYYICPNPRIWNQIYEQLEKYAIENKLRKPSIPLILDSWHYYSDKGKAERWNITVEWVLKHYDSTIDLPEIGSDYYVG